jgi:hypothetical protein
MKKKLIIAATAGALCVAASTAFALENEFHGMYKFNGYESNWLNGGPTSTIAGLQNGEVNNGAHSGWFAEQRARLQYIAKANDNLKLVTHFELDARFGGTTGGYKGTTGNDSGNLDADQLTLETKNIYLDFNCPITGANAKVGMQPWADAYQSLFLLADMTGVYVKKDFGAFSPSIGWFRLDDNTSTSFDGPGQLTADMFVADAKFAINKDMKVGGSYYYINRDTTVDYAGTASARGSVNSAENIHMFGLNADLTFGPANVKPFAAYQMGQVSDANNTDFTGYLLGATAKIKAGPGSFNAAAIYLSGDDHADAQLATKDQDNFRLISPYTSYFNASNMWILVRTGQATNTSTSILGNDITVNGRGLMFAALGYEGTMDKVFYNVNLGYAATAEKRTNNGVKESDSIGTEINAQIGYKLFDNLSLSVAAAYCMLGNGMNDKGPNTNTKRISGFGVNDADDPYLFNTMLSYAF